MERSRGLLGNSTSSLFFQPLSRFLTIPFCTSRIKSKILFAGVVAAARQIRSRRILEIDDAAGTRVVATPRARMCMGACTQARMPAGTHGRTHARMYACTARGIVARVPVKSMRRRGTEGNERVEAGEPRVYSGGL